MPVIFRRPRSAQPQQPTLANRQSLGVAPIVRRGAPASNGASIAACGSALPTVLTGPSGIATTYSGNNNADALLLAGQPGSSFTIATLLRDPVSGVLRNFVDYDPLSGQRIFQLRATNGNQWEFIRFDSAGNPYFATGGTPTGQDQVVVAVSDGAAMAVYVGGTLVASATISGTPQPWNTSVMVVGGSLGAAANYPGFTVQPYAGLIYSTGVLPYGMSAAEARKLSASPAAYWQLFAPQARKLYVAGGPPGATAHAAVGALIAQAATVAGAATRYRVHTSAGALTAQSAAVAGAAARSAGTISHASSGALAAGAATVAGVAARFAVHAASGALVAAAAAVTGVANRVISHAATGALVAGPALVSGTAAVGGLAGTFRLPAVKDCFDHQDLLFCSVQALTTVLFDANGATIVGAPATIQAGGFFRLRFDRPALTWYRVG